MKLIHIKCRIKVTKRYVLFSEFALFCLDIVCLNGERTANLAQSRGLFSIRSSHAMVPDKLPR